MDITTLATDKAKTDEGIWIDGPDGSRFKIRSTDARQYRNALMAAARRYPAHKLRKDPSTQTKANIEAMADGLVIDWSGVEESGQALPCTRENVIKVLGLTEIREMISVEAQDFENFRSEGLAADAADIKSSD